ncbi:hypothetical protein CC2G_004398 [Coprinopsis cinerea AmutBmut pab1-1]|nr:hypothetical protein CC2G_004398 [Coprinopsis cinerea AmutBmut pab1-1]
MNTSSHPKVDYGSLNRSLKFAADYPDVDFEGRLEVNQEELDRHLSADKQEVERSLNAHYASLDNGPTLRRPLEAPITPEGPYDVFLQAWFQLGELIVEHNARIQAREISAEEYSLVLVVEWLRNLGLWARRFEAKQDLEELERLLASGKKKHAEKAVKSQYGSLDDGPAQRRPLEGAQPRVSAAKESYDEFLQTWSQLVELIDEHNARIEARATSTEK